MCLPFVLFMGRRFGDPDASRARSLSIQLFYTVGRVVTYTAMAAVAGAAGSAVEMAGALVGLQRAASVAAGLALLAYGLVGLLEALPGLAGTGGPLSGRVAELLRRRVPNHPFAMGLLLGFLPCGLVYSAVIAAAALGDPVEGGIGLTLFGLGAAPALLGVSVADRLLVRRRAFINRLSQAFILAMGVWFIWRGLVGS